MVSMQKFTVTIFALSCLTYSSYCEEYTFPDAFKFGVATSAYQSEGAWNINGKGESIWDRLAHSNPDAILDKSNGDVACDSYNKIREDVHLLKNLKVDFYRFSMSWSRILPNGKADHINPDGIRYYNELIDELLANDIQPMVTMYHWDLPQALEDEGGFLNPAIADYFEKYANILFENFGHRVKHWITFNDAMMICHNGYGRDFLAPMLNLGPRAGYTCGHNLLIAHEKAYHLYNSRYREAQKGKVGITNGNFWFEPLNDTDEDKKAAENAIQYFFGWFNHPIFSKNGGYPQVIKESIATINKTEDLSASSLPEFTTEEINLLRRSADFFGLNHYTTYYCSKITEDTPVDLIYLADVGVYCVADESKELSASFWLRVVPVGLRRILKHIKEEYDNPEVIVTENGFSDRGDNLADCRRINYYNSYLTELLKAIHEDGCNVSAYIAWSFMDNIEWRSGYTERFGLMSVDFDDPRRPRTPKMSAHVYKNIIQTRKINWSYTPENFADCGFSKKEHNFEKVEL